MLVDILVAAVELLHPARMAVYALNAEQLAESLDELGDKIRNLESICRQYGYETFEVVTLLATVQNGQQIPM